jgi:hypothetical protein
MARKKSGSGAKSGADQSFGVAFPDETRLNAGVMQTIPVMIQDGGQQVAVKYLKAAKAGVSGWRVVEVVQYNDGIELVEKTQKIRGGAVLSYAEALGELSKFERAGSVVKHVFANGKTPEEAIAELGIQYYRTFANYDGIGFDVDGYPRASIEGEFMDSNIRISVEEQARVRQRYDAVPPGGGGKRILQQNIQGGNFAQEILGLDHVMSAETIRDLNAQASAVRDEISLIESIAKTVQEVVKTFGRIREGEAEGRNCRFSFSGNDRYAPDGLEIVEKWNKKNMWKNDRSGATMWTKRGDEYPSFYKLEQSIYNLKEKLGTAAGLNEDVKQSLNRYLDTMLVYSSVMMGRLIRRSENFSAAYDSKDWDNNSLDKPAAWIKDEAYKHELKLLEKRFERLGPVPGGMDKFIAQHIEAEVPLKIPESLDKLGPWMENVSATILTRKSAELQKIREKLDPSLKVAAAEPEIA